MNKSKKNRFNIDRDEISKKNPNIDVSELSHAFAVLKELQKRGIKIGPNYTLGSPFSPPRLRNKKNRPIGSFLQPA
jgi:hypothetical protein